MYSNKLICDILNFINENINSKITIEELENNFFYNRFYIMKLFKKELNITIIEYINSIRIYNSIHNMKNSNDPIIKISLNNGFYSLEYFCETFKKITQLKPYVFKKFFKNSKKISENDISQIEKTIIKLFEINNIKENYISKQKPKVYPVKKLSIFK